MSVWLYRGKEVTDDDLVGYVAFVYIIENLISGMKYIGKKRLEKVRTKILKGRRRKVKSESDWRTYYGSNKTLNVEVEDLGAENFRREILHLCKTKGMSNYLELKEQILHNALESENYHNQWILAKIHRSHIKL